MNISIPTPPWTGLGKKLESMIRKALFDYQMLEEADKVAIALSGGKDSLALLFFLKAISGRGFPKFDIYAFHVTGEFSCGAGVNLSYLQSICAALDVPLIIRESSQKLETLECYSCSRERRTLLFEAAKSVGARTIAFGHHRDDNAETLMMNLLHKGEFAGMLPKVRMHDYGVTIIRPLIYVAESQILTFARQHSFLRVTCQCPVGQTSMRQQMGKILEDIETLYPNVRDNIANASLRYGSDKASKK
jgi:tRNA 2-thiocytidine biosynthesis protein TtcA